MHYWREDSFRALAEVSAELSEDRSLSDYVLYLRLREQGLRKQAFAALERFLADARQWPFDQRCQFVDRILQICYDRRPSGWDLTPNPMEKHLIAPTLQQWVQSEPRNPVPLRWQGWRGDIESLRLAVALDPHEEMARRILAVGLLSHVDYSIHELPNGSGYIGCPSDDLALLDEVDRLAKELRDARDPYDMPQEVQYLRSIVGAFARYQREGSGTPFLHWAREQGVQLQHRWMRIPY